MSTLTYYTPAGQSPDPGKRLLVAQPPPQPEQNGLQPQSPSCRTINVSTNSVFVSNEELSNDVLEVLEIESRARRNQLNAAFKFSCTELILLGASFCSFALAALLGFHVPRFASPRTIGFIALMTIIGMFTSRKLGFWRSRQKRKEQSNDIGENSDFLKGWLQNQHQYAQEVVILRGLELTRHSSSALIKSKIEIEFTIDNAKNLVSILSALIGILTLFLLSGPAIISLSMPGDQIKEWTKIYQGFDLSPFTALLVGLTFLRFAFHFRIDSLLQHKHAISYANELAKTRAMPQQSDRGS